MGLLAAEMLARTGKDPGEIYRGLTEQFGAPVYERIDSPASAKQKAAARQTLARPGRRVGTCGRSDRIHAHHRARQRRAAWRAQRCRPRADGLPLAPPARRTSTSSMRRASWARRTCAPIQQEAQELLSRVLAAA